MTVVPGDLLLAKALSCAISVVKADCVQCGATTNRVRREINISVATQRSISSTCSINYCHCTFTLVYSYVSGAKCYIPKADHL